MKTIEKNNKEELLQAARTASEPIDWTAIGNYLDAQRALVTPREVRDNSATEGDS
jgi:hypothetical protein